MLSIANHQGNANQNHNKILYHLTPVRMAVIKRQKIASVGEDVEKREPSCSVDGNGNWCSHYGKQYGKSTRKLKRELPYGPAIPLLGIYLKERKSPC